MPSTSKPQLAIYVALAVAVLLIGARFLHSGADGGSSADAPAGLGSTSSVGAPDGLDAADGAGTDAAGGAGTDAAGGEAGDASASGVRLVVDVKGAVRRPGVYRLAAGARTYDAVRRAGGLSARADRVGVNLAARLVDGGEVVVPARGATGRAPTAAGDAGAAPDAGGGTAAADQPLSLDLNTASEQELEQLDGVGPAIAANILAYRAQHGGFASLDELDEVSGIGDAKLAAIRAQLGQ